MQDYRYLITQTNQQLTMWNELPICCNRTYYIRGNIHEAAINKLSVEYDYNWRIWNTHKVEHRNKTHIHTIPSGGRFLDTGAKFFIPVAVFWIQVLNGAWMTSSRGGVGDWIIGQYLEMRLSSYERFIYWWMTRNPFTSKWMQLFVFAPSPIKKIITSMQPVVHVR